MMTWILIFWVSNAGVGVDHVSFGTYKECQLALEQIQREMAWSQGVHGVCAISSATAREVK